MNEGRPTISTHVLDTVAGLPAAGVAVQLYRVDGGERRVGRGTTDDDGRIRQLLETELEAGDYEIRFGIAGSFFLGLIVSFRVEEIDRSYHVPLLMSPFSLATYRGS